MRVSPLWLVTAGVVTGELVTGVVVPSIAVVATAAAVGAALWCRRASRPAALAILALAVGLGRMRSVVLPASSADDVARLSLPYRTTLVARLVGAPERRPGRTLLVVEAETVRRGATETPATGRVRLAVRGGAPGWGYGDRLRVETVLRAPRNFANPAGFDVVGHLARQGIRVTGGVRDARALERLPGAARGVRACLERWRVRLATRIGSVVAEPEATILTALVLGDDGGVPAEVREAFTRAGVVHVLSVSGLHIGLVAAASVALVRGLLARSEWLLLVADVDRLAAVAALVPVLLYTALAGLGVATLRSTLMVAAAVAAGLLDRRSDVLRTLAQAALLLALGLPGSPLEIGYQLSFASVATIVLGTRRFAPAVPAGAGGIGRWRTRIVTAALVSPCALLGTAPLTAFHFHQLSLASVIANPLVVPLFGAVVTGLGLAGAFVEPAAPAVADWLLAVAGWALRPGIALVEALGAPAWAAVDVPIPSVMELGLLYVLLGAVVLPSGRRRRALLACAGLALAVDAAWWVHERTSASTLRVTFLDVGQGDAAVAELPGGRVMVVDAGGFPGIDFDTGAAVVGPFLWSRKILHIDVLAMTHAHPDHSGGLSYLLLHFRPREFWWTGVPGRGAEWERLGAVLAVSSARIRVLAAGSDVGEETTVLHPPARWSDTSLNDSSLTLRLGPGVLFTGDLEARGEAAVLLAAPMRLRSTVLKVPHHGSRTSSTARFVEAVDPAVAVMSVGADNRYRLPSPEIEAAYRARGTCLLRTDRCGAVMVELRDGRSRVRTVRPECACP